MNYGNILSDVKQIVEPGRAMYIYLMKIERIAEISPLFPKFSFKTGGKLCFGSAYGIRTRDLLLEREVS